MNIDGTYKSEDGSFVLKITKSSDQHSTFEGALTSTHTPQGSKELAITGRWYFVANDGSGLIPLNLGFTAFERPSGRPYCIEDAWVGVMVDRSHLKMNGIRTYLTAQNEYELSCLGTHTLAKV